MDRSQIQGSSEEPQNLGYRCLILNDPGPHVCMYVCMYMRACIHTYRQALTSELLLRFCVLGFEVLGFRVIGCFRATGAVEFRAVRFLTPTPALPSCEPA